MTSPKNNSLPKIALIATISGALLGGVLFYFSHSKNRAMVAAATEPVISQLSHQAQATEIAVDPEAMAEAQLGSESEDPLAAEIKKLAPEEQKRWDVFKQILASKNDNDPRMDQDLKNLSPSFHQLLTKQYDLLPSEHRNERGLVVFLMARDSRNQDDLTFLREVYDETPCLSLEDCRTTTRSDPHLSGIDQASMNYPQLAALYQLQAKLNHSPELLDNADFKDGVRAVLTAALRFPVPLVQQKAQELQSLFKL